MQTVTNRPSRARKPASAKLPYPELPETIGMRFWSLCWYFRQLAEMEAVAHHWRTENRKRRPNDPLVMAMIGTERQLDDEIRKHAAPRLVKEGLLPYAWVGTTVLQGAA